MNVNVVRTLKEKGSRTRMINIAHHDKGNRNYLIDKKNKYTTTNQNNSKLNAFMDKQLLPAGPLRQFNFNDASKFSLNDKMRHSFDVDSGGHKKGNYYLRMKKNNGTKSKKKDLSPYRNDEKRMSSLIDANSSLVKEIKESIKVSLNLTSEIGDTLYKSKKLRDMSDDSLIILDQSSLHLENNKEDEVLAENFKRNKPNTIITKIMIEKDAFRMSSDAEENPQYRYNQERLGIDLISDSQYDPKSSERPPKFQNTSLVSNPYLNPSGYSQDTYSMTQKASNVKWNERGKHYLEEQKSQNRKERNLMILSRNLRNLSYLKSPNPLAGNRVMNVNLDLNMLDSLSSSDIKIPLLFSESNIYEELSSHDNIKSSSSKYKDHSKILKSNAPGTISITSIVNRNEGKALARLSNTVFQNESFKDTVTPFASNSRD